MSRCFAVLPQAVCCVPAEDEGHGEQCEIHCTAQVYKPLPLLPMQGSPVRALCWEPSCPRALRAFIPLSVPGVTNEFKAQLGSIKTFLEKSFHKGLCLNKKQKT